MHVPFATQQNQLTLGKFGIDQRERDTMKTQVPGGEPGIFPFVGHRQNFIAVQVLPVVIATILPLLQVEAAGPGSPCSQSKTL